MLSGRSRSFPDDEYRMHGFQSQLYPGHSLARFEGVRILRHKEFAGMRVPRFGFDFPPQPDRGVGSLVADIREEVNLSFAFHTVEISKRLVAGDLDVIPFRARSRACRRLEGLGELT